MQLLIVLVIAIVASASAFAPRATTRAQSAISMKKETPSFKNLAIPAALLPFLAPMAAFAAEGTGRAFGIDDGRLIFAALAPSVIIFPLYLQWSGQQETDDFFDGYEKRRQG